MRDLKTVRPWEAPASTHSAGPPGVSILDERAALRTLAARVIERAMTDAAGRTGMYKADRRRHTELVREARQWIEQAGEGFRFWARVMGVEWTGLRDRLLAGAPTETCRNSVAAACDNGPMEDRTHG